MRWVRAATSSSHRFWAPGALARSCVSTTITLFSIAINAVAAAPQSQAPNLVFHPGAVEAELDALCAKAETTDSSEKAILVTYTSEALTEALGSEKKFLRFLTDPATSYLDRMAAANHGGEIISSTELPLLWKSVAEFESLPTGVAPSPCDYLYSANLAPSMWVRRREPFVKPAAGESRTVLDRKTDVPVKKIDYPVTAEERSLAPWPWQMHKALTILNEKVNLYYADPVRYPLLVEAAQHWQPSNWPEAMVRGRALLERAPHNVLMLQMLLKLTLDEPDRDVAVWATNYLYAWGQDSSHFQELAHAGQIAILRQTHSEPLAAQAAFQAWQLARFQPSVYSPQLKPVRSATSILAIGRWAMDRNVSPWDRYISFVNPICKVVGDPPIAPDKIKILRARNWPRPWRLSKHGLRGTGRCWSAKQPRSDRIWSR
jgi:hypothetical protein